VSYSEYTAGGNRLPSSITLDDGPWAGTYGNPKWNDDGSLLSYYGGPDAPGAVKVNFARTEPLPKIHVSVGPSDPAGTVHLTFEGLGKNIHFYRSGWDMQALDSRREELVDALHRDYGATFAAYLQSALTDFTMNWQEQMQAPDLPYDDPQSAQTQGSSMFSQPPEVVLGVVPTAYLDEQDGEVLVFAVSDGRSLSIQSDVLDTAAAQAEPTASGPFVKVITGSYPDGVVVPAALFTDTT
jgi:hypothetical protein